MHQRGCQSGSKMAYNVTDVDTCCRSILTETTDVDSWKRKRVETKAVYNRNPVNDAGSWAFTNATASMTWNLFPSMSNGVGDENYIGKKINVKRIDVMMAFTCAPYTASNVQREEDLVNPDDWVRDRTVTPRSIRITLLQHLQDPSTMIWDNVFNDGLLDTSFPNAWLPLRYLKQEYRDTVKVLFDEVVTLDPPSDSSVTYYSHVTGHVEGVIVLAEGEILGNTTTEPFYMQYIQRKSQRIVRAWHYDVEDVVSQPESRYSGAMMPHYTVLARSAYSWSQQGTTPSGAAELRVMFNASSRILYTDS